MKKIGLFSTALLLVASLNAQVEMSKTKQTLMGKNSLIGDAPSKFTLDNFSINFILYAFAEDEGGSSNVAKSSKVGVRTDLSGIDSILALEITNESYAYFIEQWKKRNVEIHVPTVAEIEASKKYSKAKSKGKKHSIVSGETFDDHSKKNHNMIAWPNEVYIGSCGSGPMAANGNYQVIGLDKTFSGSYTSFNSTVSYISFKTAKLGSTASVKTFPQLKAENNITAQNWKKGKVGNYIGSNSAKGIEDFYSEVKKEGNEVMNSSYNFWNYIADVAKYKSNVLEMIKKGMDDLFADYDRVVAENKK